VFDPALQPVSVQCKPTPPVPTGGFFVKVFHPLEIVLEVLPVVDVGVREVLLFVAVGEGFHLTPVALVVLLGLLLLPWPLCA